MPVWNSFLHFVQQAQQTPPDQRQPLVDELLQQRTTWPWVEGRRAAFVYVGPAQRVALNMDTFETDPPFMPLVPLEGTNLWYLQVDFERDDLLDYLLAVDDPMTPLKGEANLLARIQQHWRVDARNPRRISTTGLETSILRMGEARPFPDWSTMTRVPRGTVTEHDFSSVQMGFTDRKLWVYTPPGYDAAPDREYPLLVLLDGQWMIGPLQVPFIADALIKHGRMQPVIIAMKQSGSQADRLKDYVSNDRHYAAILTELLPLLQTEYRIDPVNMGLGGADVGAIAAAHAALKNPAVFSHLIMMSPPLGKGAARQQLADYATRFKESRHLPRKIFQSVGRYETPGRFYKPGLALADLLQQRQEHRGDIDYRFVVLGSGHGLVAFRSILPEALAHTFPVEV
ncbi:MAG: alpha/beta hydrolase-fold protein [Anaerolineae bacterium]|jgi:enterochelin esterase-like enzyme|nr:alpha/beta hydrolase-fold protein [Anaerolineae bacterium]